VHRAISLSVLVTSGGNPYLPRDFSNTNRSSISFWDRDLLEFVRARRDLCGGAGQAYLASIIVSTNLRVGYR
jgi:hypothetical protein